jgi:hypothetical protein
MHTVELILLFIAALSFLGAAAGAAFGRINLLGLGLFAWVLVPLIELTQIK